MWAALDTVTNLNLSYQDLEHLSQRLAELARTTKNAFWKKKLYERYPLTGEFAVLESIYSTDIYTDRYTENKESIIFKLDDDNELFFKYDSQSHKPIDLYYCCESDSWRYDAITKQLTIYPATNSFNATNTVSPPLTDESITINTLKEIYTDVRDSETIQDYLTLFQAINTLYAAIFK